MAASETSLCQQQVARVEVEAELRPPLQRFQRALRSDDVERDLRRVHLQRELHAALLVDVDDRVPALGQQIEAVVNHLRRHAGEL